MNKIYKEQQYKEYIGLMYRMANCDMLEGVCIHEEINDWLVKNHITTEMEQQMDDRMEQECNDEMNGVKKEGKIINFPKDIKIND